MGPRVLSSRSAGELAAAECRRGGEKAKAEQDCIPGMLEPLGPAQGRWVAVIARRVDGRAKGGSC